MAESTQDVHKQAKKGIRVLMIRQGVLLVLTFAGGVILARVLDPADFGLFGITTFLVNLLALFGDCGLAPSLIQRKKDLTDRDLQVGFTVQQALVTVVVAVLWMLAPWLAGFYPKASEVLIWLIRVMAFNLYLSTWRSMSVLQLERKLNYKRLAVVEVVETVSYQVVAVVMVLLGFGVWSLIGAVLARGVLGTALVYRIAPWTVRLGFDREIAREILRFGLPFQLQRIVGNAQGWVTPTLVAALIGPEAVGFLMWGTGNGRKPMELFRSVIRVSFPHFSRIQDKQEEIERTLSKYQVYFMAITGVWLSVLVAAGYDLTRWIYTDKWLPAVPVLMLAGFLVGLNVLSWSTKTALSGLGRIRFTTRVTFVSTALSLGLGVALVLAVGFIGVPIAHILAFLLTLPWLYSGLRRGALRDILMPSAWVVVPVLVSIAVGLGVQMLPLPLMIKALGTAGIVVVVYAAVAWLAGPAWLKETVRRKLAGLKEHLRGTVEPVT